MNASLLDLLTDAWFRQPKLHRHKDFDQEACQLARDKARWETPLDPIEVEEAKVIGGWNMRGEHSPHQEARVAPALSVSAPECQRSAVEGPEASVELTNRARHEVVGAGKTLTFRRLQTLTPDEVNLAFETYATPTTGISGQQADFQVTLFLWAQRYRSACEYLLAGRETWAEPDDVLSDFLVDLMARLSKGQYRLHDGNFDRWLNTKWGLFFAGWKTRFYKEQALTTPVNEEEYDDEEESEKNRRAGEHYRTEVDWQAANQFASGSDDSPSFIHQVQVMVDDPASELKPAVRSMLRELVEGGSLEAAYAAAGISERHGRRLLKELGTKPVAGNMVCIRACVDEDGENTRFEPLLGVPEAAQLLSVHEKTVQAMARAGKLPCVRMGKYWRFRASSLDAWVKAGLESNHDQSRRVA